MVTDLLKKYSIGWGFGKCNMRCKHCYAKSGPFCPQYGKDVLFKIADLICPQATAINLGTGEYIFNQDSLPLLRYIHSRYPDVAIAVTSNGSTAKLLTLDELHMFHDIDYSLDFPDPDRHNEFRQYPNAWKYVISQLDRCQKEKIETSIVTCVTGLTADDDIRELLEIAHGYGASSRFNFFRPTGRGKFNEKFYLPARRAWEIIKLVSELAEIESMSDPLFDAILGTNYSSYSGCACGVNSCRIQVNLSVTPCVYLGGKRWSGGSVLDSSLDQIFSSQVFERFRARKPKFCLGCQFWERCRGGCASRAVLYRGSLDEPDGFCPLANGIALEEVRSIKPRIMPHSGRKVHDGYLCTIICKA